MRVKQVIAAFLLAVGFCLVPALGYGEVEQWRWEHSASYMDFSLLKGRVNYIMRNPMDFLDVSLYYDPDGTYAKYLPKGVDTKGKVYILVLDNRDVFSNKSGIELLGEFERQLTVIYSFIQGVATDMDSDIVAIFHTWEETPLGYFYQGEHHLWDGK